jgi:hypothetical protein
MVAMAESEEKTALKPNNLWHIGVLAALFNIGELIAQRGDVAFGKGHRTVTVGSLTEASRTTSGVRSLGRSFC